MTYEFKCEVTALDFWKLTMQQTYRSMAGICNLIFTVAMILLTTKFWQQSGDMVQVILLFACLLFPVFQPIAVYLKAKGQAKTMPKDVTLNFDDKGLHVTVGEEKEDISWKKLRVKKQSGMLIVFSDPRHGYMLTNRVLAEKKDSFFAFAESKIEQEK